jgi:hypothetical protein
MKNWNVFSKEKANLQLFDHLSRIIVREVGILIEDYNSITDKGIRPRRTRLIKDRLSLLGKRKMKGKPEYQVYANGISDDLRQENGGHFKNAEWLYDMHWYLDGKEPYTTTVVPLVMECEWNRVNRKDKNKVPFSGIKYDFQKLLLANAELRLMIFKVNKTVHLEELHTYFIRNIKGYKHLTVGSKFLFIAFPEDQNTFLYCEITK